MYLIFKKCRLLEETVGRSKSVNNDSGRCQKEKEGMLLEDDRQAFLTMTHGKPGCGTV